MNFSEDILQQIEDYLNGSMTEAQTLAFENQINENAELAEALGINKKMRLQYSDEDWDFVKDYNNSKKLNELESLLRSKEFQDKKKAIQNAGDLYFNKEQSKKGNSGRFKLYSILTAAAVLILFFGIFLKDSTRSNQEIYTEYSSWEELPSLVSRGEANADLLSQGEKAFTSKDYTLAEENFNNYVNNQREVNVNALLYLGISHLELENYDAALESFQKIIESNFLDQSKGYWYKVLVYLKKDDKENAVKTLKVIASNPNYFNYNKAKEILEALN